jgi:ATP-dependent DNA helicase RecG
MNQNELSALLRRLLAERIETEWLEFKSHACESQQLGEYISALANSACIHGKPRGYLLFGVDNNTHTVVGTTFNPQKEKGKGNQHLPIWLAQGLKPNPDFEYYEFYVEGNRIVLYEIFPAKDQPVKFFGTAYVRVGSAKTELVKHPEKERIIWQRHIDWSAQVCERASLSDLNKEAIIKARQEYKAKFSAKTQEIDSWNDITFLNKTGLAIQGAITQAAIILLGQPESGTLLSPAVARISWVLKDDHNQEKDYEHFDPPFILNVDHVLARIRNLNVRQLPRGTMFPIELKQYEPWVLREALHNCIAHQDYNIGGRINLTEMPDQLILSNVGSFLPGSVETVIQRDAPMEIYRNRTLAQAMVNLNMIDAQGGGIKRMYQTQRNRFFPLPDYDLTRPDRVVVYIHGQVMDEKYTRLLMERTDLDLLTIILLDSVQKHRSITRDQHRRLKKQGVVEGRYPNIYVSAKIAAATDERAKHIRNRGLDRQYYKGLIRELIYQHGPVNRNEIDRLLLDKLPEILTTEQKTVLIHNLLTNLRKSGVIKNVGSKRFSKWAPT